jgi:acetyl-CoA synthetase
VIDKPWPSIAAHGVGRLTSASCRRTSEVQGQVLHGDGARADEDGYFWVMGRVDDVVNVAGHRLGTAEIESALVSHAKVAEAAVWAGRTSSRARRWWRS